MQLAISNIRLHEMLTSKIRQQEAEAFIQILENKVEQEVNSKTSVFATKEDIARLETNISHLSFGLKGWIVATGIGIVSILAVFIKLVH